MGVVVTDEGAACLCLNAGLMCANNLAAISHLQGTNCGKRSMIKA
jgi:hypothetical protein